MIRRQINAGCNRSYYYPRAYIYIICLNVFHGVKLTQKVTRRFARPSKSEELSYLVPRLSSFFYNNLFYSINARFTFLFPTLPIAKFQLTLNWQVDFVSRVQLRAGTIFLIEENNFFSCSFPQFF